MYGFAFSFLVLAGIPSAPQTSPAVVVGLFFNSGGGGDYGHKEFSPFYLADGA